jgi:capsular polysaccharide export protein
VRETRPDAHVIYKPHPDVEAGHRRGCLSDEDCLRFADEIVRDAPITALIDVADEVHVISSLAGFEALLRGMRVTTYGTPFYAGWGLTEDKGPPVERRSVRRSIDELVAAVLLLYPRYLDPVTGLPCPPEILIRRLAEGAGNQRQGIVVQLRRLQGRWKRRFAEVRLA